MIWRQYSLRVPQPPQGHGERPSVLRSAAGLRDVDTAPTVGVTIDVGVIVGVDPATGVPLDQASIQSARFRTKGVGVGVGVAGFRWLRPTA